MNELTRRSILTQYGILFWAVPNSAQGFIPGSTLGAVGVAGDHIGIGNMQDKHINSCPIYLTPKYSIIKLWKKKEF